MDDEGLEVYATAWPGKFSFVQNFTVNVDEQASTVKPC